jgi:hypothetical protein
MSDEPLEVLVGKLLLSRGLRLAVAESCTGGLIGHRITSTCLLSNVAYRTKERLVWDVPNQKMIQGSVEARKLLSREYRAPWKLTV